MEKLFLTFVFLTPLIGLYSGLSAAATIPIFFFLCFFYIRKFLEFRIQDYKLEVALIIWIIASSLWSISFINSFFSAIKLATEFLLGLVLIKNIPKIEISRVKVENILMVSLIASIIAFFIEYLTHGQVSLIFKKLMQKKESHIFFLHNLDRGIALLTLLSWVLIGVLLKRENRILAVLIYFILLAILIFSDNLAALVAHIIGAVIFLTTRLTMLKNPKILCVLFLICSSLMVIFAFKIDALEVAQKTEFLPLSAKHRLFIWNFVAKNSNDHPILGIGFNASRQFPVEETEIVELFGNKLHPLPLHPHNNIMQVYFELGMIGLLLYLSLACKYILIIGKNYNSSNPVCKDLICCLYACFSVYFIIAMISYNVWQSWWIASILWIAALCSMLLVPKIDTSTIASAVEL